MLSTAFVYEIINQFVTGQSAVQRSTAEAEIHNHADSPGYPTCLMEIMQTPKINTNVRVFAAIMLRNFVRSHWRRTEGSTISTEEIDSIRQSILGCIDMLDQAVLLQGGMSETIGLCVSADFPAHWPQYSAGLGACTRKEFVATTLRTIVKKMSTRRLPAVRARFLELVPSVRAMMTSEIQSMASPPSQTDLTRLAAFVRTDQIIIDSVRLVDDSMLSLTLGSSTALVQGIPAGHPDFESMLTVLRWVCKCMTVMVRRDPAQAGPYLGRVAILALQTLEVAVPTFRTTLQGQNATHAALMLIYQIHTTPEFTSMPGDLRLTAIAALDAVLPPSTVSQLVNLIISSCLTLTPEDLEEWTIDPEACTEDDAAQEHPVRRAGDLALIALMETHEAVVGPIIEAGLAPLTTDAPSDLFALDASLRAAGVCTFMLDDLDHIGVLHRLHALATATGSHLLQRRLASLVGAFAYAIDDIHIPACLDLLCSTLSNMMATPLPHGEIHVVGLTAFSSVVLIVSNPSWTHRVSRAVFDVILQFCMFVVMDCTAPTAMLVMRALLALAKEIGTDIIDQLAPIMTSLPNMFAGAVGEPELQRHIMEVCAAILDAIAEATDPSPFIEALLPLVMGCLDPGSDTWTNLADPAIGLLLSMITASWTPIHSLPAVADTVLRAMSVTIDDPPFVKVGFTVLDAIAFIDHNILVADQERASKLMSVAQDALHDAQPRLAISALTVLDTLAAVALAQVDTPLAALPAEADPGPYGSLLGAVLSTALSTALNGAGPLVVSACLALTSRCLFGCPNATLAAIRAVPVPETFGKMEAVLRPAVTDPAGPVIISCLVALTLDAFDTVLTRTKRMIMALGLLRLIEVARSDPGLGACVQAAWGRIVACLNETVDDWDALLGDRAAVMADDKRSYVSQRRKGLGRYCPENRVVDIRSLIDTVAG